MTSSGSVLACDSFLVFCVLLSMLVASLRLVLPSPSLSSSLGDTGSVRLSGSSVTTNGRPESLLSSASTVIGPGSTFSLTLEEEEGDDDDDEFTLEVLDVGDDSDDVLNADTAVTRFFTPLHPEDLREFEDCDAARSLIALTEV